MANTILGLFDDPLEARRAMDDLRESGLNIDDISIISRATESGAAVSSADDVSAGEGAAVGAVWGGLVGLAALLIPGVGPFVALGALGAALTGAVTGAVVGGIAAALIDFGDIPESEARAYEQQVHAGKTLVAVKVAEADSGAARRTLASAGATSIYDNQTDITSDSGRSADLHVNDAEGQRIGHALEYGAPPNPTTVVRDPMGMQKVELVPNTLDPAAQGVPIPEEPGVAVRAGLTDPAAGVPEEINQRSGQLPTPDADSRPGDRGPDTNMPPADDPSRPKV
jgi:uncharacterized membrane protein